MAAVAEFPCSLVIDIPFPTHRLADAALRTITVDEELSPLVKRDLRIVNSASSAIEARTNANEVILRTNYRATTNRMLRVAVNGFFESMRVVLQVMEELDIDVIHAKGLEGLERVQGVEQGMTGDAGGSLPVS